MPTHFLLKVPVSFLIIFHNLITVILLPTAAFGEDDHRYTECRSYYDCGLLKNISYPFWASNGRPQHCGIDSFQLTCREDKYPIMKIKDQNFLVLAFSFFNMTIARSDLWDTPCTTNMVNTTLDYDRFSYLQAVRNLSLFYGCLPRNESVLYNFTCKVEGTDNNISYYVDDSLWRIRQENWSSCYTNIQVPIMWEDVDAMPLENVTTGVLKEVLKRGFQVSYGAEWELCSPCLKSNGTCGSNSSYEYDSFLCFCGDGPHDRTCPDVDGDKQSKLKLGLVGAAFVIVVLVVVSYFFWKKRIQNHQIVEAFLRSYGPLQIQRHRYSEVKKMTNSFKEKLGQGGYGSVYKGKLKDGRLVAVKVLTKLRGDGEEFMNEVAAISRTSHVNIVCLMGYCFEHSKRALIYEFMPNGSLEKFIFDASTPKNDHRHLGWEPLYQISLGIARGLEYLHRGCNTRILHFDIKPHNILLDENFSPKISDFGLAKICNKKESIVSMLGARGTAGYIAPEVFCRNFGGVSHKSDVYSYGMMLSEIVGGRRNIDVQAENTSEIYFPHWIYKRLELDEELGLQNVMNEEDKVRARKMIIVSLWCIQTDPSNRPAMREVIDMLEGSVDSLQIPPKPYLSSPPKSPIDSSTTSTLVSIQ